MGKALVLSTVIFMVIVPSLAAGKPTARQALRWCLTGMLLANLFYLFLLMVVLPRL